MDPSGASLAAAVALVRRAYIDGLGARIAALEAAVQTLGADPAGAREVVRRHAHALRGSGATFGFPAITEAARGAETTAATGEAAALPAAVDALARILRDVVAAEPDVAP